MTLSVDFRVDSDASMGGGHVSRCIALAKHLEALDCRCTFFCRSILDAQREHIVEYGFEFHMLNLKLHSGDHNVVWSVEDQKNDAETFLHCHQVPQLSHITIVDHYGLSDTWEACIAKACCSLIVSIDDLANRKHHCDVLVDATVGGDESRYLSKVDNDCTMLCGAQYALLRDEFMHLRALAKEKRQKTERIGTVLISFGSADKQKLALECIEGLTRSDYDGRIIVAASGSSEYINAVQKMAGEYDGVEIYVHPTNMAELILESDFSLGAPGVQALERMALGLPSLVVPFEMNQALIAENLKRLKLAEVSSLTELRADIVDLFNGFDMHSWHRMARDAFEHCDGEGATRVAETILESYHEHCRAM